MEEVTREFREFLEAEGIDKDYLDRVRRFFLITDKDREILSKYKNELKEVFPEVFQNFLEYLSSFDEIREILEKAHPPIEKIKKAHEEYFDFLLNSDFDVKYVLKIFQIVKSLHYRYGVKIGHYLGAYLSYIEFIFDALNKKLKCNEVYEFGRSFLKVVFLDIYFTTKIYYYFLSREIERENLKYKALREGSFDGIVLVDWKSEKILDVNKKLEELIGKNREELIGKNFSVLFPPDKEKVIISRIEDFLVNEGKGLLPNVPLYNHKTGEVIPTELNISSIIIENNEVVVGIFRDIRDRIRKEEELERISRLYRVLYLINEATLKTTDIDLLFERILRILVEEGGFSFCFIAEVKDFGQIEIVKKYGNEKAVDVGKSLHSILEAIKKRNLIELDEKIGAVIPLVYKNFITSFLKLKHRNFVIVVYGKEARNLSEEEKRLLTQIGYDIAFAVYSILRKEEIKYLSYYDVLTNLPNRRYFIEKLENAIRLSEEEKEKLAVMIIDIDNFKNINTVYGEFVGDLVLKEVSKRIRSVLRGRDVLARFGNDEFAVLSFDIKSNSDVMKIITRIKETLNKPIKVDGRDLFLSVSIGVAIYPDDGRSAEEIIASAVSALNEVKKRGGNGIEFFNPSMKRISIEIINLQSRLRRAIKNGEFILYYQPIVDLEKMKIVGAEALLRWKDPKEGLVPPFKFIPVLEDTGMITEVGEWVIEEVVKQQKEWEGIDIDIAVSLNVSPKQFIRSSLAELILKKIDELDGDPSKIIVEITESTLMENISVIGDDIETLSKKGVRVEIDDFGTGYSSLAYLKKLPVYALKIDREFIKDIPEDKDDIAIVKAIIGIAKSLDRRTVAEGIESEEQLELLRYYGCDYGQGYLFSPPLPPEEFLNFCKKFNSQ